MQTAKTKHRRNLTSTESAKSSAARGARAGNTAGNEVVQGEGNYEAAREFNAAERRFVESGRMDAAARAAAPKTDAEQQEMLAAEQQGRSRAKEDYPPPPEASPRGPTAAGIELGKDAPRKRR